jgi:hypothetical protein
MSYRSYEIAPRTVTLTSGLFRILTPAKSEQLPALQHSNDRGQRFQSIADRHSN